MFSLASALAFHYLCHPKPLGVSLRKKRTIRRKTAYIPHHHNLCLMQKVTQRLESLDVLRGFDLFCLVALEGIMHPLARAIDAPWFDRFMWNFTHVEWEGLSPWDVVMPLFLFMAGVSMPFALSRYRENKPAAYRRIVRRVVLLWVFGMMCQGNLLGLDPDRLYLYSNTLQAIAIGYLVTALLFLHTGWKTQVAVTLGLLLAYWGLMGGVSVDGYGGGNYTPGGNLAEWVDRTVLGRFRDGATVVDGQVVFASWYDYTWILSSLGFAATVLTGLFAGYILKNRNTSSAKKLLLLIAIGTALVAAGWLWSPYLPVIKRIWTSSMVLVSSGWCFLIMALFYFIIDCCHIQRPTNWLKIYGMNSIAAYMLSLCVSFGSVSRSLFWGLEAYVGPYYPVIIATSNAIILYQILRWMYHQQIFLRV